MIQKIRNSIIYWARKKKRHENWEMNGMENYTYIFYKWREVFPNTNDRSYIYAILPFAEFHMLERAVYY